MKDRDVLVVPSKYEMCLKEKPVLLHRRNSIDLGQLANTQGTTPIIKCHWSVILHTSLHVGMFHLCYPIHTVLAPN